MNKEQTRIEVDTDLWWEKLPYTKRLEILHNVFDLEILAEHPTAPTVDKKEDSSSEEDDIIENALRVLIEKLKADNKLLRDALQNIEGSFYMDICRAYNAGKQCMNNQHEDASDGKEFNTRFVSSHDYFKSEFPEFTKNVP